MRLTRSRNCLYLAGFETNRRLPNCRRNLMKKYFAVSLVALLLVSSLALVPRTAQAQGPGLVSSILNKMERNRRDLRSLRASMTMQKYNAQLHDYDMSYGQVAYIAGKSGATSDVRVD